MRFAILADIHYSSGAAIGKRRGDLADILLLRAVHRLNRYLRPDAVVLLGDLVNDGKGPRAEGELRSLRRHLDRLDAPVIVLPGNHDPAPDDFYRTMPRPDFAADCGGIRFLSFLDAERPGYNAERSAADLARLKAEANRAPGPLVCLQHVPLLPPDGHDCPYHYTNADAAIAACREAGVTLVVSGHYHRGVPLLERDGIRYLAAPALCEAPFRFLMVEIEGDAVRVEEHTLAMPDEYGLVDTHVHTPLAYCGENLDMRRTRDLAQAVGLAGMVFTEHSGHLYFDAPGYGRCAAAGLAAAPPRQRRTATYFGLLQAHGVPASTWGMEVDAGWDGSALVSPGDNRRLAFRIGAMHSLRSLSGTERDAAAAETEFMAVLERFLPHGFHSLAHPFRVFRRAGLPIPASLFARTAKLLKQHRTAAEINYHTNEPPVDFIRICLEEGVKLTFGSDAHNLYEVGEFFPHLALLREAGFAGQPGEVLLPFP